MDNSSDLFSEVILKLRACASVPVVIDEVTNTSRKSISISRLKLNQMINSYWTLYKLVHKCWSNLPDPPCSEKTYLFMWAIACDDYSFNHGTISWEGSTLNTFVHLWSIIDRIKLSLERVGLSWIVGERNCADYCKSVGVTGPLDEHMYPPEFVVPDEILKIDEDVMQMVYEDSKEEFCSFHDFTMSTYVRGAPVAISASDIAAMNDEVLLRRATSA